jgi:hypothetical protein
VPSPWASQTARTAPNEKPSSAEPRSSSPPEKPLSGPTRPGQLNNKREKRNQRQNSPKGHFLSQKASLFNEREKRNQNPPQPKTPSIPGQMIKPEPKEQMEQMFRKFHEGKKRNQRNLRNLLLKRSSGSSDVPMPHHVPLVPPPGQDEPNRKADLNSQLPSPAC